MTPRTAGSSLRSPADVVDAGRRRLWRARKALRQRLTSDGPRRGVFIVGCQRSGTSMLVDTFDRSPSTAVHSEHTRRAFRDYRLRDAQTVRRLIEAGPAPVTVLKPICDSQLIDHILDQQPLSQAVWAYRHPADVARSALAKWGSHQLEVVEAIAAGRGSETGWRGERVPGLLQAQLRELVHADSENRQLAGAMLFWLLRNSLFFELGLDRDTRVGVVSYERVVADPPVTLGDLFLRTGCAFGPATFRNVQLRRVAPRPAEDVAPEVVAACESLLGRLDEAQRSSAEPSS